MAAEGEVVVFERLRVAGFGPFRGGVSAAFPKGLGVLARPNEWGKSTLVHALAAVVFGLPRAASPLEFGTGRFRNREHPHEFAGELVLLRGRERFRIVRNFEDHRVRLSIEEGGFWRDICAGEHNPGARRPNPAYEAWLLETFGHASRALFEATFCVVQPLPAPQRLDASLRALLAGGEGGGRTEALEALAAAARRLTRRTGALGITARDGRKEGEIEELDAEIEALQRSIAASEASLDALAGVIRELGQTEQALAGLERRRRAIEAERAAALRWLEACRKVRESREEAAALARAAREVRRAEEAYRSASARLLQEYPEFDGADPRVGEALFKWSELERALAELGRLHEERDTLSAELRSKAEERALTVDWDLGGLEGAAWARAFRSAFIEAKEEWSRLAAAEAAREQAEGELARLRTAQRKLAAARLVALLGAALGIVAFAARPDALAAGVAGAVAVALLAFAALGDRIPPFSRASRRVAALNAELGAAAAASLLAGEEGAGKAARRQGAGGPGAGRKGRAGGGRDLVERVLCSEPARLGPPWEALQRALKGLSGSRWAILLHVALETVGDLLAAMEKLGDDFWREIERRTAHYDALSREILALELAVRRIEEREIPGKTRAAEEILAELEALLPGDWGPLRKRIRAWPGKAGGAPFLAPQPLARVLAASGGDAARARARSRAWEGLRREAEKERATLASALAAWGCETPAALEERLAVARARLEHAIGELESFVKENPAFPSDPDADVLAVQRRVEELEREREEAGREAEALRAAVYELRKRQAELEGAGTLNVAAAKARVSELLEERERLWFEAEALALAYKILQEAAEAYYGDHVGRLSRAASAHFAALSGRPERRLTLSEELEVGAVEPDGAPVAVAQLSLGTQDLLYIALRLAIADLTAGGRRLPFLFDDPFVNFDKERLARMRTSLERLASERQVLLFTHREELVSWGEAIIVQAEGETP